MKILIIASFWIFIVSTYGDLNEFNRIDVLSPVHIHGTTTTKEQVYKVDANQNNNNQILTFQTANSIERNEAVLHSNDGLKLSNPMILKSENDEPSSNATTTTASDTPSPTTTTTTASDAPTTTTTGTADTTTTTNDSIGSSDSGNTTPSAATLPAIPTGEPPPTHSAKLGMGFGITLIGVFIIGEIIYFKCFYQGRSSLSRDDYIA